MSSSPLFLSPVGYRQLKKDLEYYTTEGRAQVAADLRYARSLGDLSENAEYEAAREAQAQLEDQIRRLEGLLARAVVLPAEERDDEYAAEHAARLKDFLADPKNQADYVAREIMASAFVCDRCTAEQLDEPCSPLDLRLLWWKERFEENVCMRSGENLDSWLSSVLDTLMEAGQFLPAAHALRAFLEAACEFLPHLNMDGSFWQARLQEMARGVFKTSDGQPAGELECRRGAAYLARLPSGGSVPAPVIFAEEEDQNGECFFLSPCLAGPHHLYTPETAAQALVENSRLDCCLGSFEDEDPDEETPLEKVSPRERRLEFNTCSLVGGLLSRPRPEALAWLESVIDVLVEKGFFLHAHCTLRFVLAQGTWLRSLKEDPACRETLARLAAWLEEMDSGKFRTAAGEKSGWLELKGRQTGCIQDEWYLYDHDGEAYVGIAYECPSICYPAEVTFAWKDSPRV